MFNFDVLTGIVSKNFKIYAFLGSLLLIISILSFTYYKGYQNGKKTSEKEITENYIEIINKRDKENKEKLNIEFNKYTQSIEENNKLKKDLNDKEKDFKLKLKSKSLNNKDCNLEKEDVKKFNNFIDEINK